MIFRSCHLGRYFHPPVKFARDAILPQFAHSKIVLGRVVSGFRRWDNAKNQVVAGSIPAAFETAAQLLVMGLWRRCACGGKQGKSKSCMFWSISQASGRTREASRTTLRPERRRVRVARPRAESRS